MSKAKERQSESRKGRVQVSNLPQQQRQLKNKEAANIKGGGGVSGGVNGDRARSGGEEIPQ